MATWQRHIKQCDLTASLSKLWVNNSKNVICFCQNTTLKHGFLDKFQIKFPFCNTRISLAYFLVEKRRGAIMRQEKLSHLMINMAQRILHIIVTVMNLPNTKLEIFLTKKPALSFIIRKCSTIRKVKVRLTRKICQSKWSQLHVA